MTHNNYTQAPGHKTLAWVGVEAVVSSDLQRKMTRKPVPPLLTLSLPPCTYEVLVLQCEREETQL